MNAKCCKLGENNIRFSLARECWEFLGPYCIEPFEVAFCPHCGHDLSKSVYDSLEAALLALADLPPLAICFDVDGVLCDDRDQTLRYADRPAYPWVSRTLHALKAAGHTIRIQTARYMQKFDGDQKRALENGGFELRWWLRENDIPFDEVYLGKCSANLYVDDRGCRVESNRGTISWLNSLIPTLAATQARKAKTS